MKNTIINNRYKLIKKIGKGGSSLVYKAIDTISETKEKIIAIKILSPSDDKEKYNLNIKRLKREVEILSELKGNNIVKIYDYNFSDNNYYIVMEYLEGSTLKQIINKRKFEINESLDIIIQIAKCISQIHKQNIIHRDIKPENIIYLDSSQIKILDLGISFKEDQTENITEEGNIIGSMSYIAPEIVDNKKPTKNSDIYSLGIILYELLAGKLPYGGKSGVEIARKHLEARFPEIMKINPKVNNEISSIIANACNKDPSKRYKDIDKFILEIETVRKTYRLHSKTNQTLVNISFNKYKNRFNSNAFKSSKKQRIKNKRLLWLKILCLFGIFGSIFFVIIIFLI